MTPTTGAELLAQVRSVWTDALPNDLYCALDGCVLLTADEVKRVRDDILDLDAHQHFDHEEMEALLALLSPAGKDET